VPVTREAIPAQATLDAIDMGRGGLLPEGSFGGHHPRRGDRERHPRQMSGRIADHRTRRARFAGRAGPELEHHAGRDIARAGAGWGIVHEGLGALDPYPGGDAVRAANSASRSGSP